MQPTQVQSTYNVISQGTPVDVDEIEIENREAFYEELYERLLAIEYDEYDCGQCSEEELDDEEELENCTICNCRLENHKYGNVCVKHIPSYALWDDEEVYEVSCYEEDYEY